MFDVKVNGMDEILKKLKKLPDRVQKNVVTGATRAAAKPLVAEARRLVPVRTGNLQKSIGVVKRKTLQKNIILFSVTPRKGKNYDGFYGHLVEFGTKHSTAKPFLRPAFEAKGDETIDYAREYMRKRVDKEIAKL